MSNFLAIMVFGACCSMASAQVTSLAWRSFNAAGFDVASGVPRGQ